MVNLSVELAGVKLKNPVIPASGTFGYGREFAQVYDLDILGSFSFKGTTAQPRFGNPQPRIAEAPGGMLNAVGLQNPGIDRVIEEELPSIARLFHGPVIANIGGNTVDEYAENCRKLNGCENVGLIEVNISCPNVHCGGKNFGSDPCSAAEVTRAVKAASEKPVFMKLSPNGGGPCWPTAPAGCPARRCSRWRCGWCGTCTRPWTCPSSAAAACPRRRTCAK